MSDKSLLANLLRTLGLAHGSEAEKSGGEKRKPDRAADTAFREFEARLDKTLSARRRQLDGRLYLLSFAPLREHLGDRWAVAEERIHALIGRVLDRRLVEHDLYIRYGEDAYLIVFTVLGTKEAQLKCTRIAEDVLKRLVGTESVARLIDISSVHPNDEGGLEMRRIPPAEALVGDVVRMLDSLPTAPPSGDGARESSAASGDASGEDKDACRTETDFIFRPLLTVRTKIVSTFLCFPVRPRAEGGFSSGYGILPDPNDADQIRDLDLLTLKRVAAEMPRMTIRNARSLLGIPVHWRTLSGAKSRTDYAGHCARYLMGRENQIVFELIGLPSGIPHARLTELHALLRPHSRAVIARVPLNHSDFSGFKAAGVHAVGIDIYNSTAREKSKMTEMDEFIRRAKGVQLKTYVHGIRTISLYTAAVCSGFDYLAGYALTSVSEVPRDAYAFSPDMPYLSLFGKK